MAEEYVPRILLCGDINSFANAADMPVEVIGQISFSGSPERGENYFLVRYRDVLDYVPKELKIFLDGKEISAEKLREILDGAADYIVFDDGAEFVARYNDLSSLKIPNRFIPRETLFTQARHGFYSDTNFMMLAGILRNEKISRVLDVDGIFYTTDFIMFPNLFPHVDALAKNLAGSDLIAEDFYERIYDTLADCRFKRYDALLVAERAPEDFVDVLLATDALSENILMFLRKNSALERWLAANQNAFEKIFHFPALNGNWYLLTKRTAKDFCVYVVTHKDAKLDALPEGYRIIHAGHAQAAQDFGYLGDDTGDNISTLNRYLNEVTALYWMWKNTTHAIIGLNHYRRFFTESNDESFAVEKILSRATAEEFLHDYDIIVAQNKGLRLSVSCWQRMFSGSDLEEFVADIFRNHIALKQPDYLDSFEHVANAYTAFQYEMFITRRNIFDAYCEWLFSFIIDVTDEVLARTNIAQIDNSRKYRTIGIIAERLLTVWLRKNRLRIKRLPILFRKGI